MLMHETGRDIDNHDIVIRVNLAPVSEEFRTHVGLKDSVRGKLLR